MNYWTRRDAVRNLEENGATAIVPHYPDWFFKVAPVNAWSSRYHRAMARIATMPKFADYLKRAVAPGYVSNEVDAALDMEMQILALVEGSLISSNAVDRFGNDVTTPEGWTEFFLHFPDVFHYLKSFANDAANFAPVTDEEKAEAASGNLKRGSNTRRVVGAKA